MMTLRSDDPRSMLVLRSASGEAVTKTFALDKAGSIAVESYPDVRRWDAEVVSAGADPVEMLTTVEAVSELSDAIIVMGALKDEGQRRRILRRYKAPSDPLERVPRSWFCVDVDGVKAGGRTIERQVKLFRDSVLPECFQDVACVWQASASYGVFNRALRAHLWFLLDEPLDPEVLRRALRAEVPTVDSSVLVPTQPIYVAAPVLQGLEDPMDGEPRLGLLDGSRDALESWAIPGLAEAEIRARDASKAVMAVPDLGVKPNAEQIASAIERIEAQTTTGSRHHHAFGAVCELMGLGADPEDIAEVAEHLIVGQGRELQPSEVENLIRDAAMRLERGDLRLGERPVNAVLDEAEEADEGLEGDEETGEVLFDEEIPRTTLSKALPDFANATTYLRVQHQGGEHYLRWGEQDWEFIGTHWKALPRETLKARIQRLGGVQIQDHKAGAIANAVRSIGLREGVTLPGWLTKRSVPPGDIIVCRNGLLHVDDVMLSPEDALLPHDANYFNTVCLPYDYDPGARAPRWERFVREVFPEDKESQREFQKMFGYLVTNDNTHEKFFVLAGAKRGGKGVTTTVLKALIGHDNVGAMTLNSLGERFGLADVDGKSVALINEANAVTGRDVPAMAIDRLKMITGNDPVNVERKRVDQTTRKLALRFVMSCNRIPRFYDPSGALMLRMVLFEFKRSFAGREDPRLKDALLRELSGILNWAIEGARMLCLEDKRFVVPGASQDLMDQITRSGAPIEAFTSDCIEMVSDHGIHCSKDDLYGAYRAWAEQKEGIERPMTRETFFTELRCVAPHRIEHKREVRGSRTRVWTGMQFSEEGMQWAKRHDPLFA